jgi:hypothetical protein
MKNVFKLENYYLPWEMEQRVGELVEHYNYRRVHESLDCLTPADMDDIIRGRAQEVLVARQVVMKPTLRHKIKENMGLPPLKQELLLPQMVRENVS